MKKLLLIALSLMLVLSLAACGKTDKAPESGQPSSEGEPVAEAPATVTIKTLNGNKEPIELEVPYNPTRVAVMDMAVLDMLDNWGLSDRIVGMAKNTHVDYLAAYFANDNIQNLGTLHESDLEAMMAAEPEIIFIGGRMASQYDALSEIAPVVYMATDYEIGLFQSIQNNATAVASIFGVEDKASQQLSGFDARIDALATAAEGKTAVIGIATNGGFNTLGNGARCSIIGGEVGFENLANDVDATHGNETSFELLVSLNPDYIFVLDRDSAIAAEGAQLAKEVVENELVQKTDAYQNGNIVYLTPAPWYLAEGGLTSFDLMLGDLEGALLK